MECNTYVIPSGYITCLDVKSTDEITLDNLHIPDATTSVPPTDRAHIVAVIHPSNNLDIISYSSTNLILDAKFPTMEPTTHDHENTIFGRRFGVLVNDNSTSRARKLTTSELLRCYSIPKKNIGK